MNNDTFVRIFEIKRIKNILKNEKTRYNNHIKALKARKRICDKHNISINNVNIKRYFYSYKGYSTYTLTVSDFYE